MNPQPSTSLLWGHFSLFKGKGWEVGGKGATPPPPHALEQPAKVAAPSPPTPHPDDSTDPPERVLKAEVRCISGTHLDAGRSCRVQSWGPWCPAGSCRPCPPGPGSPHTAPSSPPSSSPVSPLPASHPKAASGEPGTSNEVSHSVVASHRCHHFQWSIIYDLQPVTITLFADLIASCKPCVRMPWFRFYNWWQTASFSPVALPLL